MSDEPRVDAETLIRQLAESVQAVEPDDLPVLAKMHGWCQQLSEQLADADDPQAQAIRSQACELGKQLEALILGETEDPAATLSQIQQLTQTLAGGAGGEAADAGEAGAEPRRWANQEASDPSAVEAQLSKVFDEEPEPPQPAEPPAGATAECSDAGAGGESPQASAAAEPAPAAAGGAQIERYEQEPLVLSPDEAEFVKGFVEEAGEHLEAIEAAVLEVENSPDDRDKINDLFRPFHTIKGMAGFLNLRDINRLTHEVETLLDQARKGQRQVTPGLIDVIFEAVDVLKAQIAAVSEWVAAPTADPVPQPPVAEMINRLRQMVAGQIEPEGSGAASSASEAPQPQPARVEAPAAETAPAQPEAAPASQPAASAAPAAGKAAASKPAAKPAAKAPASKPKQLGDQSIRIDTGKLDALIDLVGELVIAQTLVQASDQVVHDSKLAKDIGQVTKIVREVQEVAMSMRMVPIGPTFQKMARLARDVSRKAGKKVNLTIEGEETELDKTVIQQIGDPLVHMIRNAIDHGIETPEQRVAAGKPEAGEVHLAAGHRNGNVVIEIRDDGKGLDAQKLIAKAIERGIVQPGEELTDQQAYNLIFAPGFSTAEQVTDISGRGVGMDVVRRNIEQLRGKVEITSQPGQGTTFTIHLPLTLAIIDGMIVRVGRERYIIPTVAIEQSLRPRAEQITNVQGRGEILNVRGQLVPLIQLGALFGLTGWTNPAEAMVVVARCEDRLIGLVVDDLLGQQQVVIKSLGERFRHVRGISGAAILGDGRVGLILEMPGLAWLHEREATRCDAGGPEPARDAACEPAAAPSPAEAVPSGELVGAS